MESNNEENSIMAAPLEPPTTNTTPVAKKTRRATRKEQERSDGAPKTPTTCKGNETPRRSARKSIRPPLDYEDIMLRSASKDTKVTGLAVANTEEDCQKWSVAEVGRNSGKRIRKSKRTATKKAINENEDKVEDELNMCQANKKAKTHQEVDLQEIKAELDMADKVTLEDKVDLDLAPLECENQAKVDHPVVASEDMNELGLTPLESEADTEHSMDEMPSLILLEDEVFEAPINVPLNNTFDTETENAVDQPDLEMPKLQMSPEKPPKVVLTTADNQDITLLKSKKSSKGYRFPTPHKSKVNFKFSGENLAPTNDPIMFTGQLRRRSKSASALNEAKTKTVSFCSPIEIACTKAIDKPLENLDQSRITTRRKRSMSLDERVPKASRIPQPKFFAWVKPATTPNKQKLRTKMPNFAAMHQKQFDKMENLVDHLERKAERAKVLTNSALKQKPIGGSAQKTPAKDIARPRAIKKMEVFLKPEVAVAKINPPTRIPFKSDNCAPKAAFNLSTSLAKSFATQPKAGPTLENKMKQRQERHMAMFKGRQQPKEKTGDFIRGVRLNRRFELQMQHRRHLEEE